MPGTKIGGPLLAALRCNLNYRGKDLQIDLQDSHTGIGRVT